MLKPLQDLALDDDVAISVEGASKNYGLWSSPSARIRYEMMRLGRHLVPSNSSAAESLNARMAGIYTEFHALQDVSLQVKKGESWGVIGVNGSGKSTLLKIVAGKLRPSTGRVVVDGKVALLDYSSGLHGDFTGRENIFLKSAIMGMSRREIEAKYKSIVGFADIGEFIDQPVKTYSSGMSARLGFAIIAHTSADIIISDEALAVGDAFFVQKCMDFIRAFLKKGTFLYVTHSTNDVVNLCQKAVWLEHGRVRAIGAAKTVAEAYLSSQSLEGSRRYIAEHSVSDQNSSAEGPANGAEAGPRGRYELGQPELAQLTNARPTRIIRDPRTDLINGSAFRNDIEIPALEMSAGFGIGGAKIEEVIIEDTNHAVLSWIIGGDLVRLCIVVRAERALRSPIIGFQVQDRLGQTLFADNTYLTTVDKPLQIAAGELFSAEFDFQMPLLPVGEYAIRAGVADGGESNNAMLHCIDTALVFRSVTSGSRHGLVGVPMQRIRIGPMQVVASTAGQSQPSKH